MMRRHPSLGAFTLVLLATLACARSADHEPQAPAMDMPAEVLLESEEKAFGGAARAKPMKRRARAMNESASIGYLADEARDAEADDFAGLAPSAPPLVLSDEGTEGRVRTWFPEAFLWRPSVVTDNDGVADLDVRVPDQLTTWRVLALAHDGNGHQAGTTHTFDSVLPVSVDPVTPDWLYAGDQLVLPSQTSALGEPFRGEVSVEATGSLSGAGGGAVSLLPGGSQLVEMGVVAERSGRGTVRAELFGGDGIRIDGAERVIDVRPTGRPIVAQRGGVLSGERTLTLDHAGAAEQRVVLRVFPGPLSLFQAELERVGERPSGAYGYALLAGIQELSDSTDIEVDAQALRTLRIRAWQRLVRASRNPSGPEAMALLTGLVVPDDDPLAKTTHDRLVRTLASAQRGDGTWSHQGRTTAQHVLVQTAASARALPEDARGPRLRASGALERLLPNVDDPYTAAWLLTSGVVDPSLHAGLLEQVHDGLEEIDGRWRLKPVEQVKGPKGWVSRTERLAVAWLALATDAPDSRQAGDLLAELLGSWSTHRGFGGGWADALALQAIQQGLPSLDQPVALSIERDGRTVATGTLDPKQPKLPVVLTSDAGELTVRADPPVPGLVFAASHTAWVPFTGEERLPGVDVEVAAGELVVGQESSLTLTVAAPRGVSVDLTQGIPAGTSVILPPQTLAQLTDHTVAQDHVALTTKAFGAGEVLELELLVTPMYAGQMNTRPLTVAAERSEMDLRPLLWNVR